jgi:hypothetical protein
LTGASININAGTNRLWIDGSGQMDVPMTQGLDGQPLSKPGSMAVNWQDRMNFDGRTVAFEGTVVATAPHQDLRTESLEVTLQKPIRFDEPPKGGSEIKIERVRCHGGVSLENRSFGDDGSQSSLERIQVAGLDIQRTNGQVTASGPGWMTTVRHGLGDLTGQPGAARPVSLRSGGADPNQLSYLSVRFRGSISGNLNDREMTFRNQVHTAYGPVDSWSARIDVDDLASLGPKGVLLSCDQLKVALMPVPGADAPAIEMESSGNVIVEGQSFNARAVRMTYTQSKDLLLLEGDGRTDARLYYQPYLSAPYSETAAQQIWYWRAIPKVQIHGAKSFQWTQFPGGSASGK